MLILQTDSRARVQHLAFAPNGHMLAAAGQHLVGVQLFDLYSGRERLRFTEHIGDVQALAFSPDGDLIASADMRGQVKLWDADRGVERSSFFAWPRGIHSVAFSPDGGVLAGGSVSWWTAAQVRRWDVATGRELPSLRGHDREITSLAFSPDGQTLATGSRDRTVRLWDATTGLQRAGIASRVVDFLRVLGWGRPSEEMKEVKGYRTEIRALTFSPDGELLAAATGWSATIWQVATGTVLATPRAHRNLLSDLKFSPDGRTLATASRDGTVRFWETVQLRQARSRPALSPAATFDWGMGRAYSVAFAPDGTRAAAGGDGGQIVVWDLE